MGEVMSSTEQSAMGMEVEMNKEVRGGEERRSSCKDGSSSVVRWERFLPRMAVRVLLVEADDSTRQIISALLRKCNYKVAAVPDGLKAWEVLKGKQRNIDLIITEVELPSISGFALLTLIMEDESCKNIPVIMMSSHDSMGMVYKCMMRGASDFLMKPIRINELKNLWQHVWRRQSSTIGHRLGAQCESVAQQKAEATAENNAASDHSSGPKALLEKEDLCFKKGIDAQNSCGNPDLEAKSTYGQEESQDLSGSKKIKFPVRDTMAPQDDEHSRKSLCSRANVAAGSDEDLCKGKSMITRGTTIEAYSLRMGDNFLSSQASEKTNVPAEPSKEAIDLIGAFDNKGSHGQGLINGSKTLEPELNLSLRRSQIGGYGSNTNQKNVLIHSNASAFSRYINKRLRPLPRESTCSGEHSSIHVQGNYSDIKRASSSYNRSEISLPMHHRQEAEVALPCQQHTLSPIPVVVRGVNSLQHVSADHAISHEQRFICIDQCRNLEQNLESLDEKSSFSPTTDQSGSDSFCNGAVSHTNRHGSVCASNGNMNPFVPLRTAASENGNVDERFTPPERNPQRSIQREAALTKFRLKRKERCFEKKVRYESRKKLADQRPRVKGQFVRRIPPDPPPANPKAA